MKIALLSPVAWSTPPKQYGPWEQVVANLAEALLKKNIDVTVFATRDSTTPAKLRSIVKKSYNEDKHLDPKVAEGLHIGFAMEQAYEFDIIHNHFDFLPLTYSRLIPTPMVTTIHGFSSPKIIPVYAHYNSTTDYVSISDSDRSTRLSYLKTVYNGLNPELFTFSNAPEDYLLSFSRIHPDKGISQAISIAKKSGRRLIIAGLVQDEEYFRQHVEPHIDGRQIEYAGNVGPEKRDELLKNAFALLHPICFNEPFGLSVAEAMMCGTPVIAFNRGSMSELIAHGQTGFLVNDVAEAVEYVKVIPTLSRAYCRQWSLEKFSAEKMAEGYLEVYETLMARKKKWMKEGSGRFGSAEAVMK